MSSRYLDHVCDVVHLVTPTLGFCIDVPIMCPSEILPGSESESIVPLGAFDMHTC